MVLQTPSEASKGGLSLEIIGVLPIRWGRGPKNSFGEGSYDVFSKRSFSMFSLP